MTKVDDIWIFTTLQRWVNCDQRLIPFLSTMIAKFKTLINPKNSHKQRMSIMSWTLVQVYGETKVHDIKSAIKQTATTINIFTLAVLSKIWGFLLISIESYSLSNKNFGLLRYKLVCQISLSETNYDLCLYFRNSNDYKKVFSSRLISTWLVSTVI